MEAGAGRRGKALYERVRKIFARRLASPPPVGAAGSVRAS